MKTHKLKTFPAYFRAIVEGRKSFEIRKNDRDFQVGDVLLLQEYKLGEKRFTGQEFAVRVVYLTDWDQKRGRVVMGIVPHP